MVFSVFAPRVGLEFLFVTDFLGSVGWPIAWDMKWGAIAKFDWSVFLVVVRLISAEFPIRTLKQMISLEYSFMNTIVIKFIEGSCGSWVMSWPVDHYMNTVTFKRSLFVGCATYKSTQSYLDILARLPDKHFNTNLWLFIFNKYVVWWTFVHEADSSRSLISTWCRVFFFVVIFKVYL